MNGADADEAVEAAVKGFGPYTGLIVQDVAIVVGAALRIFIVAKLVFKSGD